MFSLQVDSLISEYKSREDAREPDGKIAHLDEHLVSESLTKDVGSPTASIDSLGIIW